MAMPPPVHSGTTAATGMTPGLSGAPPAAQAKKPIDAALDKQLNEKAKVDVANQSPDYSDLKGPGEKHLYLRHYISHSQEQANALETKIDHLRDNVLKKNPKDSTAKTEMYTLEANLAKIRSGVTKAKAEIKSDTEKQRLQGLGFATLNEERGEHKLAVARLDKKLKDISTEHKMPIPPLGTKPPPPTKDKKEQAKIEVMTEMIKLREEIENRENSLKLIEPLIDQKIKEGVGLARADIAASFNPSTNPKRQDELNQHLRNCETVLSGNKQVARTATGAGKTNLQEAGDGVYRQSMSTEIVVDGKPIQGKHPNPTLDNTEATTRTKTLYTQYKKTAESDGKSKYPDFPAGESLTFDNLQTWLKTQNENGNIPTGSKAYRLLCANDQTMTYDMVKADVMVKYTAGNKNNPVVANIPQGQQTFRHIFDGDNYKMEASFPVQFLRNDGSRTPVGDPIKITYTIEFDNEMKAKSLSSRVD